METEERAGEAGRGGDDRGHLLADDLLGVRACLAVEADLQLSHRCRASCCENQQGQRSSKDLIAMDLGQIKRSN